MRSFKNQLTGIQSPTTSAQYRYDGLGRRIEKAVGVNITRYIYDNEDILLEYNGNNTLQARYTHGPGIDEPLVMERGGQNYFYHADGLGSIIDLTNAAGTIVQSYVYDSFGNIVAQTGSLTNSYTYTGREFDPESGLYYYRARYYDARIGRFLQGDPVGYFDSMNLYTYVKNNPVKYTDPSGKVANVIIGAVIGAAAGGFNAYLSNTNVWSGVLTGGAAGAFTGATFGAGGTVLVGITAGISGNLSNQITSNVVYNKPALDVNFVSAGLSGLAGGLGAGVGVSMAAIAGNTVFDAAVGSGLVTSFWQTIFTILEGGINGLIQNSINSSAIYK